MIQRSMEKKRSGQGGFTLIELLIVIVILGILAAIVVLAIGGLKGSSQTASCNSEQKTIATAEDANFASTNPNTYAAGTGATGLWRGAGNVGNLLKDNPTPHFDVAGSATGYSIAPHAGGSCDALAGVVTYTYGTP